MAAFAVSIGVSKAAISKWEAGVAMPRRSQLEKVLSATNGCVTPQDFGNYYYVWGK